MPLDVSVHLRYLYQDKKETISQLVKRYPNYPRTTIQRHAKKTIGVVKPDGRFSNRNAGRRKKLSERDVRQLESSLHKLRTEHGTFHSTDIEKEAGFNFENVSNRTIRRALNTRGYSFTQCRKKKLDWTRREKGGLCRLDKINLTYEMKFCLNFLYIN